MNQPDIIFRLEYIEKQIRTIKSIIETCPDLLALTEIIKTCKEIDDYYKEFCEQRDEAEGEEKGTNYRDGVNMEFYIEGLDWYTISVALRRLEGECDESEGNPG
jgi:hypothetical protein